eukprot:CAMPEP_0195053216 /NCGR_PEP_ID=MMETSP0448-20130528/2439_1 /TAXON_ID=66468 /ORGANISM="Heterocapsa triquestra, Strain CCMP 448" /LENGTH=473 /DNA_ID=CAMNT_0040082491 /DNA_START=85 /DNA_END=1506 /DNA_ORIENTATION=+
MALAWGMRGWEVEVDESPSFAAKKGLLCRSLSDSALEWAAKRTQGGSECEVESTGAGSGPTVGTFESPLLSASSEGEWGARSGVASSGSSQHGDGPHSDLASDGCEKLRKLELPPAVELQDGSTAEGTVMDSGFNQDLCTNQGMSQDMLGQDVGAGWMPPTGHMIVYLPVVMTPDGMVFDQSMSYQQAKAPFEACDAYEAESTHPDVQDGQSAERSALEMDVAAAQLTAAARRAEAVKKSRAQRPSAKQSSQQKQAQQPQHAQGAKAISGTVTCKYEERTSIMLRNLPNDYTLTMLLALLDAEGFSGRYDFAYLPVDFTRWAGFGYAFVNMVSHVDAQAAWRHFQGFNNWQVSSQKTCEVCWGDPLQGLAAHVERYRNSPVMHESVPDGCKPAMFNEGRRIAFPPPTKRIRAPRAKQPGHGRAAAERTHDAAANCLQQAAAEDALGHKDACTSESEAARRLREAWEIALSRKV